MSDKGLRMTYAELKAALEALTPEQLAQHVVWTGDERGGYVRKVWIAAEDWIGDSSDPETWLPCSEVAKLTGDEAKFYEQFGNEICLPRGTVHLTVDE